MDVQSYNRALLCHSDERLGRRHVLSATSNNFAESRRESLAVLRYIAEFYDKRGGNLSSLLTKLTASIHNCLGLKEYDPPAWEYGTAGETTSDLEI